MSKEISSQLDNIQSEVENLRKKAYEILDAIPQSTLMVIDDAAKRIDKIAKVLSDFEYCSQHYQRLFEALKKMSPEDVKKSAHVIGLLLQGLKSAEEEEAAG